MKVTEIFRNTKTQLSFNLPPQQLWSKNCQTAKLWIFVGHQVIHSESAQNLVDFDIWEWKKNVPHNSQSQSNQVFTVPFFVQQVCQTCLPSSRNNTSRYKLQLENEIITTVIGLIAEKFSNFEKKFTEFEQKLLAALSEPKSTCPHVYFAKGIILKQKFNFEILLDFNEKNTILRVQRSFFGKSCFFPI